MTTPSRSFDDQLKAEQYGAEKGRPMPAFQTPITGATGTFVSGDVVPKTITVVNGIITTIV